MSEDDDGINKYTNTYDDTNEEKIYKFCCDRKKLSDDENTTTEENQILRNVGATFLKVVLDDDLHLDRARRGVVVSRE